MFTAPKNTDHRDHVSTEPWGTEAGETPVPLHHFTKHVGWRCNLAWEPSDNNSFHNHFALSTPRNNKGSELKSWHSIIMNMGQEYRLNAWDKQIGCMRQVLWPSALGRPRGIGWRGRWEGGSGWGTQVNPWLIHANVWQKNHYNIVK